MSQSVALTRVRVVIGDRVLNLLPGSYLVGRGPQCHIVVDDARASRVHARLTIDHEGASIEDAGSANGVYVNGQRVSGSLRLASDDSILIGQQEIRVQLSTDNGRRPIIDTQPEALPSGQPEPASVEPQDFSTAKTNALQMLGEVAEKALAAGDAPQAETMIRARLLELLDLLRARQHVEPEATTTALRVALDLAHALRARRWLDYGLELLTVLGAPCSPDVLRQVRRARIAAGPPSPEKLAAYSRCVRALPMSLDKVRTVALLDELAH